MPRNDRDSWLFEPDDKIGETVADGIYRRVIDLVLFGEFAHGDRLILQDLADRFSVSLTPVREALQHLAADGFIESEPRKGYRVKSPSLQQVKDLWSVRAGLEAVASEAVIDRIAAEELQADALDPVFAIQRALDDDGRLSHRRHMELNAQFHQTLVTLSNNASSGFVKSLGENARGVIVTQVFPYERSIAFPMVREAQDLAKLKGMNEVSPAMLEGFAAAKVLVEGLRRAGPKPTRDKLQAALENLRKLDIGGLEVSYAPDDHTGLDFADLSIIGTDGKFKR